MSEEIEYPSKERERAKVNVKVSAEVNTYLHDLYNQIQYEFCEQYEDEIKDLQQKVEQQEKEIDRLNNIIDELENTIANFMENHTEGYIDWKYDREIYLAESNVLQKLYDTYLDKLKALKEDNNNG